LARVFASCRVLVGHAERAHMMSVRSCDEEVASDSSEMMKTQGAPWRKLAVVASVCAPLFLTLAVIVKREPQESSGVMESLIDLHSAPNRDLATCTHGHTNCWGTRCCTNPHHKCYAKNQYWAQCMGSCRKNFQDKYDRDRNIKTGWKCLHPHVLDGTCARDGKSCQSNTKCCRKDAVCYVKHDGWATCNPTCKRGVGANAYDRNGKEGWSCEIHGLTYGSGKTLPEGATIEEQLDACMKHYCPKVKKTSSASQKAACWSKKCSYYYDQFKHTTTTVTTTTVTTTTVPTTTYNKPKPTTSYNKPKPQ